ncbi:MAG: uroporphyrinogen-III C-methyltransferase, partial [Brevinematia bacterium]
GPGDKGLITVRGAKILSQCDVVVYDYLCGVDVLEYCRDDCEKVCAEVFSSDHFSNRVEGICNFIVSRVREGKKVVRLKGGDPSIFAKLEEEEKLLKENGIDYVVVPGVTSAFAGASILGIPLTSKSCSPMVTFITGHEYKDKTSSLIDWKRITSNQTLVIYMGVQNVKEIAKNLINISGFDPNTPVVVLQNISTVNQKFVFSSLSKMSDDVLKNGIKPPAIFIVGKVVDYSTTLNWYVSKKKILFTGISEERFFEDGIIFHVPMVKIVPLEDYSELRTYVRRVCDGDFDWLVFCSRYGVLYFFKSLFDIGLDSRYLKNVKISAIGLSTANMLKNYGIIPDLVPKNESSEGLLEEFRNVKPGRIFMPRSDLSDKGLGYGFSKLGFEVEECIAYRNIMPEYLPDIDFSLIDEIIFTSPSTVRNFIKRYNSIPANVEIKCIGPKTEMELRKYISV